MSDERGWLEFRPAAGIHLTGLPDSALIYREIWEDHVYDRGRPIATGSISELTNASYTTDMARTLATYDDGFQTRFGDVDTAGLDISEQPLQCRTL